MNTSGFGAARLMSGAGWGREEGMGDSTGVVYVGVFLDEASRAELLTQVPPAHADVHASHLTIAFRPSAELLATLPLGEERELEVFAVAADDRGQAVAVRGVASANAVPHITVSTAPGTKPFYSNDLLARTPLLVIEPFRIRGVVDTYPRSRA